MKLTNYSKLAASALCIAPVMSGQLSAQIAYTDIDPDVYLNGWTTASSEYDIDLDGDGDIDLTVNKTYWTSSYGNAERAWVEVGADVALAADPYVTISNWALPLSSGAVIDSNLNWRSSDGLLARNGYDGIWGGGAFNDGLWCDIGDAYLGIRLDVDGDYYYGWLRLEVGSPFFSCNVYIRDLAGQEVPNTAIKAGEKCEAPENPGATVLSSTSVSLTWDPIDEVDKYQIRGREVGSSSWSNRASTTNSFSAGGISPGTTYEWQVRARCLSGQITEWTALQNFATPPIAPRIASEASQQQINLYPNPASDILNLQIEATEKRTTELLVLDLVGKVVHRSRLELQAGQNQTIIDLSKLSDGIYLVQTANGSTVRQFTISK